MSPPEEQVFAILPKCTVTRRDLTTIVAIDGEIDCATASAVEAELQSVIAAGPAWVSIDLSGVTFLGVAGLHLLEHVDRELRLTGGRLDIVCCDRHRRLFAITELDQKLNVHSVSDAVLASSEPGGFTG